MFVLSRISISLVLIGQTTGHPHIMNVDSAKWSLKNDLNQFVAGRSHKSNSILDLVFSNVANLSVTVAKQLFSDHIPIYFYLNSPEAPLSFRNVYSKSSFNTLLFNSNLQPLFTVMSHDNSIDSFADAWYSLISDAFTNAIKLKR